MGTIQQAFDAHKELMDTINGYLEGKTAYNDVYKAIDSALRSGFSPISFQAGFITGATLTARGCSTEQRRGLLTLIKSYIHVDR